MARVKRGVMTHKRHKKLLMQAKGFRGARSRHYKVAHEAVLHALAYAYRDRRNRKRDFRRLWIQRINAAARIHGTTYSRLIAGMKRAGIDLDRKMLADLAVRDLDAFGQIVDVAMESPTAAPRPRGGKPARPTLLGTVALSASSPAATLPLAAATPDQFDYAGLLISAIEFDPEGSDLEGEYVLITNSAATVIDLSGWTLRDFADRHIFTFPAFSLAPGAEVRIWTRQGSDDAANLYWAQRRAVWNNEGDTAVICDPEGAQVTSYTYAGAA